MIKFKHSGNFNKSIQFLTHLKNRDYLRYLDEYAKLGVEALRNATPIDSGETASSWGYEVKVTRDRTSIVWTNSNVVNGVPIAIILQYGHATRSGGYVKGIDYINPAIKPIFDNIADNVWKEVAKY